MGNVSIVIMLITLFSKLLAFLKDVIITNYYGVSSITDIYFLSNTIAATSISLIMMGVTTGFIPLYNSINSHSRELSYEFANKLITILFAFGSLIILLFFLFSDNIISVFSSNFTTKEVETAILFTRINILTIYFTIISTLYNDILRIEGSYIYSALSNLIVNVSIIVFIIISVKIGSVMLVIGNLIGLLFYSLFLRFRLLKFDYKYKFKGSLNFRDENLKKLLILSIPLALGVGINEINTIIDRAMASRVQSGGISYLTYGYKIFALAHTTLIVGITTVSFPLMTKLFQKQNTKELMYLIRKNVILVSILLFPLTFLLIGFSTEIVSLIYGRGEFNRDDVEITSNILSLYSLGLIFYGFRDIISYAFYAQQNTVTPMKVASIAVIINIILNIVLSTYFGLYGLTLATSISGIICSFLMWINFKKTLSTSKEWNIVLPVFKVFLLSVIMYLSVLGFSKIIFVNFGLFTNIIFSFSLGILFYICLIYIFNIEESRAYFKKVINLLSSFNL